MFVEYWALGVDAFWDTLQSLKRVVAQVENENGGILFANQSLPKIISIEEFIFLPMLLRLISLAFFLLLHLFKRIFIISHLGYFANKSDLSFVRGP